VKPSLPGASTGGGPSESGCAGSKGLPAGVDVQELWKQVCEDPSFDRRRRQIGQRLTKLGVQVNSR